MSGISEINCLNKNCSIVSDDERYIVCWLCHGLCHFKCSGLPVLVAESLTKHKGLQWCCNGCRKIGVDFYRFFQGTKTHFLEIQNNISDLSNRINSYGKLFDDYKSLNFLNSPNQSSPKRRISARNLNKPNPPQENGPSSSKYSNIEKLNSNKSSVNSDNTQSSISSISVPNEINTVSNASNFNLQSDTSVPKPHISPCELKIIPPKKQVL